MIKYFMSMTFQTFSLFLSHRGKTSVFNAFVVNFHDILNVTKHLQMETFIHFLTNNTMLFNAYALKEHNMHITYDPNSAMQFSMFQ